MKQVAAILKESRPQTRSAAFEKYIAALLMDLCRIDTTPKPDVAKMRSAEDACFRILERELASFRLPGLRLERRSISPAIKSHPNYSLLHFTKTRKRPAGLTPEETYTGRSNLICHLAANTNGSGEGQSLALNAHIDVVAPYLPPRRKGDTLYGRGSCDDKGPVVAIVAAMKVLARVLADRGVSLNRGVLGMFVVEEETGGNGSLSLAIDRSLKRRYDSILVGECTDLKLHPANRGAVWYRLAIRPPPRVSAFETFAFINEEMEKEGAAIRAESRHPLFPQRPVQTCHGILGPFGEHPSRICGEVSFTLRFRRTLDAPTAQLVRDCLDAALAGYIGLYGDKTAVIEPATSKPMVARHYDVQRAGRSMRIDVHGATGHMGAIRERDGAITKMAHLVRGLVASRARIETAAGGAMVIELCDPAPGPELVAEGGQGFVPTHSIEEVMRRLREAAARGANNYLRRLGRAERGESVVHVAYEKLHNTAFDGDPKSPTMRRALAAAKECALWKGEPVLGWTVSCDARLFASEYPGMDVITFGPGKLACAHSDHEQIALDDIRAATEFLVLFILRQTGTLG